MSWARIVLVSTFFFVLAACHVSAVVSLAPGTELGAFPNTSSPATSNYQFDSVQGVAVDSVGNIYVADYETSDNGGPGRVVVLSPTGALLHAFPNASSAATSSYQFAFVLGVAVDSAGNIYVADLETSDNGGLGRVVVLSATGALLHAFPNASSAATSSYQFDTVAEVAVDSAGNIYVADYKTTDNGGTGRVVVLSSTGALLHAFPNTSSAATSSYQFDYVLGVAVDSVGNIYVADYDLGGGAGRVVVLSPTGALLHAFPNASSAATSRYVFDGARGVAVDSAGNIYVADQDTGDNGGSGRVVVLSSTGALLYAFPNTSSNATKYLFEAVAGVAVDSAGNIYVADQLTIDNGGTGRVVVLAGVNGTSSAASVLSSTATPLSAAGVSSSAFSSSLFSSSSSSPVPSSPNSVSSSGVSSSPNSVSSSGVSSSPISVSSSGVSSSPNSLSSSGVSSSPISVSSSGVSSSPNTVSSSGASSPPNSVSSSGASSSPAGSLASSTGIRSAVVGDPMFIGLRGQHYQVHGIDGAVYNLITDEQLLVNARFHFLSSGRCPTMTQLTSCWSHPGSYLGEVGIRTVEGDSLVVSSGEYDEGFASIMFNEARLSVGMNVTGSGMEVHVLSTHELWLRAGNFELHLDNSDRFINIVQLRVLQWHMLTSHGLVGQTWRQPSQPGKQVRYVEGDIDDYVEQNNDLLGNALVYGPRLGEISA